MNKTLLLAGVAAVLVASNANAVEFNQYVSGKLTYSDASHDVKWSDEDESGKMKFSDNVWGGSLAYGVKTGAVRTELELNIKQDAEKKVTEGDETTKATMENNSIMVNAYYDIDTGTKLTPYVSAGMGVSRLKGAIKWSEPDESGKFSKSKTNFAWQIGAGAAYALTDNVSIDAGYRYTDAGDVNVKNEEGGSNKFEAQSHEFLLGARYTF